MPEKQFVVVVRGILEEHADPASRKLYQPQPISFTKVFHRKTTLEDIERWAASHKWCPPNCFDIGVRLEDD